MLNRRALRKFYLESILIGRNNEAGLGNLRFVSARGAFVV